MNLSVIIIAKNEEKMIANCIKSVSFADEIIVIDDYSKDKTLEIAKKMGAKVYKNKLNSFASQRNYGLSKANGKWILFIDADERVTASLRANIKNKIFKIKNININKKSKIKERVVAYKIHRKNYYFGNHEWPKIEKLERLFFKKKLKGWYGKIHESPLVKGKIGELKNYLIHYTHNDLESMVNKTNEWSKIEAEIIYKTNHPKMSWWRFLRIMSTKFFDSYIKQGGWKLGTIGLIESMYQAYSYFIIYAKVWEKQQVKLKA